MIAFGFLKVLTYFYAGWLSLFLALLFQYSRIFSDPGSVQYERKNGRVSCHEVSTERAKARLFGCGSFANHTGKDLSYQK
jgi:hypothetical protein